MKAKDKNPLIEDITKLIVNNDNLINDDVIEFTQQCVEMTALYVKKNHDYGNSFDKGNDIIGPAYAIGRIFDKVNRLITLSKVKAEVNDESIIDTIRDLGCYSVMFLAYISKNDVKL